MLKRILAITGIFVYTVFISPVLFFFTRKDPEVAHQLAMSFFSWLSRHMWLNTVVNLFLGKKDYRLEQNICGIKFANPFGIASGFIKNPFALRGLAALGPGFIIAGSYTAKAQVGNERPRIWRYPKKQTLINFMGLPNVGAKVAAREFQIIQEHFPHLWPKIPIGISISMSAGITPEEASTDYCVALKELYPCADFIVINISCPNSLGIVELQSENFSNRLLCAIMKTANTLANEANESLKPIFVKISPDLETSQLNSMLKACKTHGVSGVVVANTTTSRDGLDEKQAPDKGGMSGSLLLNRCCAMIDCIHKKSPELVIIGVGGISTPTQAYHMIHVGASLVKVYTGFVYQGPFLFLRLVTGILSLLKRHNIPLIKYLRYGKKN